VGCQGATSTPNEPHARHSGLPDAQAGESEAAWATWRWLFVALLALELLAFSLPTVEWQAPSLSRWANFLLAHRRDLLATLALAATATVFLSWPELSFELRREETSSSIYRMERYAWFVAHLLAAAGVVAWVAVGARAVSGPRVLAHVWLSAGAALAASAITCWCLAFASADFWSRWLRASTSALVAGVAIGMVGCVAGHYIREIPPLQDQTLLLTASILRWFGQHPIVDPTQFTVGTPSFTVIVGVTCSGLEGIGLMLVFTAGYLWFCRRELRFPHALILLPVGAAAAWLLNSVRIAVLILIGSWSRAIALHAFHSLAGWALFIGTALGMVAVSRRTRLWVGTTLRAETRSSPKPADAYLVPLLVMIAARMATAAFFPAFDFGYPLQAATAGIALWCYHERLKTLEWTISGGAITLGAIAAVIWVALDRGASAGTADRTFAAGLDSMSSAAAQGWLAFRAVGFLLIAPVVEELAFRGYVLRKLVCEDFESVPFSRFTTSSFLISSLAFGLLHSAWLAGTVAGMIFALAMYRGGRLSDAIGAHAAANGMLVLYACVTGHWSVMG
jgi:exosortase E/protease (VPEID-CTERM system)